GMVRGTLTTLARYDDSAHIGRPPRCCEQHMTSNHHDRTSSDLADDAAERPYHHGDLRAALIQAGLAILAEQGAEALTVRAAARRAGVSHNAPYRHFADKDALLAAIAEEGFNELAEALERARLFAGAAPRAQLEETGWAYVRFALDHPQHFRVMFSSSVAPGDRPPGLAAAATRAFGVLVAIVRAGQAAGVLTTGEPWQLALTCWAQVHGLAQLLLDKQVTALLAGGNTEPLVRLCLRQQIDGLARHG
ncbi:MAG TPA: TetR/AcrR family transcriptional regulator, partial [Ktedonobacterales bacterium]|nr:TetR/AcrR family transcriptional regulator [Ktedonobacterales bacterium]